MRALFLVPVLFLAPLIVGCTEAEDMPAAGEPIPAPDDVEAPPDDAERSESGLAWVVLEPGDGETSPGREDLVRVHYTGWETDGRMFDSSVARGEPATFPVANVIEGWVEGLQLMSEGERRRLWIPAELAYGNRPDLTDAPQGMLVFDVELIEVLR